MATDGQRVMCDGKGCKAAATMPVGLRNDLASVRVMEHSSARGWLFVKDRRGARHFCPSCARHYLREHERAEV